MLQNFQQFKAGEGAAILAQHHQVLDLVRRLIREMKLRQFTVKNVTSYKEETIFKFDDRLNILIGPNGGGKSNLQKIIALVLSNYFVQQYEFKDDEQSARIEPLNLWTMRVLRANLDRYFGDESDQVITLDLVPERSDTRNIRLIRDNLETFNERLEYWQRPFPTYAPAEQIGAIEAAGCLKYRIINLEMDKLIEGSPEWAFAEYLHTFFIFMRLADNIPSVSLTSPLFFFFSERTANRDVQVQLGQITEQQHYQGYRNLFQAALGDRAVDLFQWGMQHFIKLWWRAIVLAATTEKTTGSKEFRKNSDVIALMQYLQKLGYLLLFQEDAANATYRIALQRDGIFFTSAKFSSGEREIVHFLLAIFALNVKDGLILLDEPELHLHPRWQRIYLQLFRELSRDRNNQFLIATHSPVFVTEDTINEITRIFGSTRGSRKVALGDVDLPHTSSITA